jgi:secretory phospholipase A2
MGELGNVINDVASGVQKLGKGIRQVEEFLDATVDEECIFECPDGGKFQPNPDHKPSSNGCGSLGLEDFLTADVLPLEEFVECCDDHDICYGTCGSDKDTCDLHFKKCLYKKCRAEKDSVSKFKHKGCQAGAKVLHAATTTLGCKSFINAQKENCLCPSQKGESKSKSKASRDEF